MPLPIGAILGALSQKRATAGGLLSLGYSAWSDWKNRKYQTEQNEKDRLFQKDMYSWSHKDAIDDWNRQNAYNHPSQVMARLKEAGLNPNLVYGNGADATAGPIRSGTASGGNQPAPKIERNPIAEGIATYQASAMNAAQVSNIRQSTELGKSEQILKEANTAKVLAETARTKFDLDQALDVRQDVVKKAKLENDYLNAITTGANIKSRGDIVHTQIELQRNEREQLANSANVELTVQHILESKLRQKTQEMNNAKIPIEKEKLAAEVEQVRQMTKNAQIEGRLKSMDEDLRSIGLMPSDPYYWRAIQLMLQGMTSTTSVSGTMTAQEALQFLKDNPDYR